MLATTEAAVLANLILFELTSRIVIIEAPFFQITLPFMVTFVATVWAAMWIQKTRRSDIMARLMRIENLLSDHDRCINALDTSKWG